MATEDEHDDARKIRLSFKHAVTPVVGVLCFLAGLATTVLEPTPTLAIEEVVAMKPVEGESGPPAFTKTPIEALNGVPSKRTEHLWPLP